MVKLEAIVGLPPDLSQHNLNIDSLFGSYGLKGVYGSLDCYIQSVAKIPVLRYEEQEKLHKQYRDGTPEQKSDAMKTLITHNLKLVVKYAKWIMRSKRCPKEELVDLISEGNIGLFRAVEKYRVDLGYTFATYAVHWIKQSIRRAIINQGKVIRLPMHADELRRKLIGQIREYHKRGIDPSIQEIARVNNIPEKKARMLVYINYFNPASLDSPVGEDSCVGDFVSGREVNYDKNSKTESLHAALHKLKEREREVLSLRFGLNGEPMTLKEIGDSLGVTRERIRQIEEKALRKLRSKELGNGLRDYL